MKFLAKARKNRHLCQGSVLIITIFMSVIVSLVTVALSKEISRNAQITNRDEKRTKAFFLAEAGISDAFAILKEDFSNKDDPSNFGSTNLGTGSYDVSILQPSSRVVIQSIGNVDNVTARILIEVKDRDNSYIDFAFFANDDFRIDEEEEESTITGNVHSNADVDLGEENTINGDVSAGGSITGVDEEVNGTETEGASPVTFPQYDFNYYYNMAQNGGLYYDGDQTFSSGSLSPGNGVVYINGNVTLSSMTVNGAIIATGNITVNNNLTQNKVSDLPSLMSRDGTIYANNGSTLNGLLYTNTGDIRIDEDVTITGQITAFGRIILTVEEDEAMPFTFNAENPPGLTNGSSFGLQKITYSE